MTQAIKRVFPLVLAIVLCACAGGGEPQITGDGTVTGEATSYVDPAAPEDGGLAVGSETAGTVLDYFTEIAFGSEYGTASEKLCRWEEKIVYKVTGSPTESDLELIGILTDRLNGIGSFPGIKEASLGEKANFEIMFITRAEMMEKFDHATEACAGMSEYRWSTETCEIIGARAAIDCEEEEERASTVCEEILQSLGLAMDSYAHADSVFYQGKCIYQRPSELDWGLVELLYHPELRAGMSRYEAISAAAGVLAW